MIPGTGLLRPRAGIRTKPKRTVSLKRLAAVVAAMGVLGAGTALAETYRDPFGVVAVGTTPNDHPSAMVAVANGGNAYGWFVGASIGGQASSGLVAAGTGGATAYAAISAFGPADSGFGPLAVSVFGDAWRGAWTISGTGDAYGAMNGPEQLALAPLGNSSGGNAVSGTGSVTATYVGVSGLGSASSQNLAVSGASNASSSGGSWPVATPGVAIGGGNATGRDVAISGEGDANGNLAISIGDLTSTATTEAQRAIATIEAVPDPVLGWDWSAAEAATADVPLDPLAFLDDLLPPGDSGLPSLPDLGSDPIVWTASQNPPQYRGMCKGTFQRGWSGDSGLITKRLTDNRYYPNMPGGQASVTFKIVFRVWQCTKTWTAYTNVWVRQSSTRQTDYFYLTMRTQRSKDYLFKHYAGDHPEYVTDRGRWTGRYYWWDVPISAGTPTSIYPMMKTLWSQGHPSATYGRNWCWPSSGNSCLGWGI